MTEVLESVISHTIKGEIECTVPEALNVHTLSNLLNDLPLPESHKITEVRIDQEQRREDGEYIKTGKFTVYIEWEGVSYGR